MSASLDAQELAALLGRVFTPSDSERLVGVFADLPDAQLADNPDWKDRRALALELASALVETRFEPRLVLYRNARANNADLPERAWMLDVAQLSALGTVPEDADALDPAKAKPFGEILDALDLILAPTELSTTAPLKLAAPGHRFKAATMPGFSRAMIPALRLDYQEINRRVMILKDLLDRAEEARIVFAVDGAEHVLTLDLRHRAAHASGGLVPELGKAGNLPSGETYIVPYEGEHEGDPSRSAGSLPVQFGDEVVVYQVEANKARVQNPEASKAAQSEAELLAAEPAYGNLSELGLGVLDAFGVEPCGEILLDEKLGLHIAFGRSNHFGGQVGPDDFSSPEAVVHIDRVYIPKMQPKVRVVSADLRMADGGSTPLMRDGAYAVDFG